MIRYCRESLSPFNGIVEGVPAGLPIHENDIAFTSHDVKKDMDVVQNGWERPFLLVQAFVLKQWLSHCSLLENRAFEKDKANWPVVMNKEIEADGIEK